MSLPDIKTSRKLAVDSLQQRPVVQLNVGGQLYTTTLPTLRKYPNSKLAEMFDVPHKVLKDSEGRCFIDRDGTHFKAILDYLRSEEVPSNNILELHKEAVYYGIQPLVKLLEESPELFGEKVGRQQFLSRVHNYHENLEVLIKVAKAEAMASRYSTIIICIVRAEEDLTRCNDAMASLDTRKESIVSFGPWNAQGSVGDLLDCIKMDIKAKGYKVYIKPNSPEKGFLFKSHDFFHKLVFTWW